MQAHKSLAVSNQTAGNCSNRQNSNDDIVQIDGYSNIKISVRNFRGTSINMYEYYETPK
jgi:hypothetical protein